MAWREGQVVVAEEVGGRVVVRAADGTARRVYGGEGVKADAALRGAGGVRRELRVLVYNGSTPTHWNAWASGVDTPWMKGGSDEQG